MSTTSTILIIDDDDSIRRLCLRILRKLEYHSLEAATGQAGYDILAEHVDAVDAVLLDLNLPDGSGIAWADKLQALKANIPVIFFTGTHHSEAMSLQTPHRLFLKKPFSPETMCKVLGQATGRVQV